MRVDHRLAAVELIENGREIWSAKPLVTIARHESKTIYSQRVAGVCDLTQATFDVGERKCREQSKAARVSRHQVSTKFVGLSRYVATGSGGNPEKNTPGCVIERTEVWIPVESMSASGFCTVQLNARPSS